MAQAVLVGRRFLEASRSRPWGGVARRLIGYTFLVVALLVELQCPMAVAVDGADNVYVVDASHLLVRISDVSTGDAITLGAPGSGSREFNNPMGVGVDRAGRIYIADSGNHRTVRINDMSGNGWTTFGRPGEGVGEFARRARYCVGPARPDLRGRS